MQQDENYEDDDNNADILSTNHENTDSNSDSDDYEKKSDTAEDFSDITELAEDIQTAMQPERPTSKAGDEYDIEAAIPASTVKVDASHKNDFTRSDSDDVNKPDNDKELMPPPSAPPKLTLKCVK